MPAVLINFLEHLIAGDMDLNDFRSLEVQHDALSIINNFLCIVRPDKQVDYKPNSEESTFYHKDATLQQIGIISSSSKRNKNVIDILSSFKMQFLINR